MNFKASRSVFMMLILVLATGFISCARKGITPGIVISKQASFHEMVAAKELRRYFYLRTGHLPTLTKADSWGDIQKDTVLFAEKGSRLLEGLPDQAALDKIAALDAQEYWLKTLSDGSKKITLVVGGDGQGVLYGAYQVAEKLGIRFFLEGDVIPEEKLTELSLDLDETVKPLFPIRGILPFHDFPEGPDWWNLDNYKAILGQLPKLRMNFIGLHTYPERGPNAEPTVWIGRAKDANEDGRVAFSYPASYQNTIRGNWGYEPKKTSDFHFGASLLFERDDYGNDVMRDLCPEPIIPEETNIVFNRAAVVFRNAFEFARQLGVMTCVGTETPLTIPEAVRRRLREAGWTSIDQAAVKELYKGIYSRIANTYPIDYYWFWTWEGWTWDDASPEAMRAVTSDLAQAVEAWEEIAPPFRLATCGWVLGPPSNRALFDQVLPKDVVMSAINREVGKAPVEPGFARLAGRSRWAIPWLEDDPSLTSPQLWAGRMRRDAADALRYGCDGLIGLHWRTRVLSPNVLALARAAWNQDWNTLPRSLEEEIGPVGGKYAVFKDQKIVAAREEAVYQDVRDRVFAYHLPTPDGRYNVTLKFIEGQVDRSRGRVFDVFLQGRKVIDGLDIFARAGKFRALDFTFRNIEVREGRLDIDFNNRIHYPVIAAIVVEGRDYSKKINCGGPAAADYVPDWPETALSLPCLDFYRDWAENQFGKGAGTDAADLLASLDGNHPIPVSWTNGPGGILPDPRPWSEVQLSYAFVDKFAALRPKVAGVGNLARFDYWLKNLEYMREVARFRCLWDQFNQTIEKIESEEDEETRSKLAWEWALPQRIEMSASLRKIFGHLLDTVSNTGELGTIANWEQHILPDAWEKGGEQFKELIGTGLPAEAELGVTYEGEPRIVVPAVRTSLEAGEELSLKCIILSRGAPEKADFYWRKMGKGKFQSLPLWRASRGVYNVTLPTQGTDIEYYIKAKVDGAEVVYPPTAPRLNQTIVVFE